MDDLMPLDIAPSSLVGRVVAGRYRVLEHLGSGGMGIVYRVEHVKIGKVMALKVLHADLAARSDVIKRFRREAEAASRLRSAHTVQVFDFGECDGLMYLAMEYIEGKTLDQLVEDEGPLSFERAARLIAQACASVTEAHEMGIVHRDIKPENVMVTRIDGRETAKVLDFGLAKLRFDPKASTLTATGLIIGTPEYMCPEQIRGEPVDARGDVYALGCTLYFALVGRPPFSADVPFAVLTKHLTEPPFAPSLAAGAALPEAADAIVLRSMAKDPAERFPSASALRASLEEASSPLPREVPMPSHSMLRLDPGALDDQRPVAKRNKRSFLSVGGLAVALGLVGFATYAVAHRPGVAPSEATLEVEPNDTLETATPLQEHAEVFGYIGRRLAPDRGDVDVYRLDGSAGGGRPIRVELSGLPNMDLRLEILREGQERPLYVVDAGGVGEGEIAPNLQPTPVPYFVRIREHLEPGQRPTENVSDRYSLRWRRTRVLPDLEREPNGAIEKAEAVRLGGAIEGYIGYEGDVDVYCLEGVGGPAIVRLSGVPGVDLNLRIIDRREGRSRRVNQNGVGEGETSPELDSILEGRSCFEISARAYEGARTSNGTTRYRFELDRR